jgi:hypothetical protein
VREHVAWPQHVDDFFVGRRWVVDMGHQWQADLLGDLERDPQRRRALGAGGVAPNPHLDADDQVAVGVRHLGRVDRRHKADVLALADVHPPVEAVDAGE